MTIRLLSTYDGFAPNSIITIDPALEASFIAAGNATANLTGGVVAYRERQPVMIQPAVKKRGSVSLIANRKAIVPLTEGSALTITPTAGTTGTYQRYDATGAAVGALTTIGATPLMGGPFEGDFTVEIKCTTGALAAKTGDGVLVVGQSGSLTYPDGSRRPLAESYSPASKGFPMIYDKTRKVLNTSTPAFTGAATGGTETYIDFNRGNDANPGTRAQPKKNLSVLNATGGFSAAAGAIIALASDSAWDLVATTTVVNQINLDNVVGSSGSPVLITSYDPAGHTGSKPTIHHSWRPAANEWTYEAALGCWSFTITNALYPGPGACCFLGPNKLPGINVWQDGSAHVADLPPMFSDYQFSILGDGGALKKFLVYAPAGTNPTTYYGGVMLSFAGRGALFTGLNGLRNTIIDGLKFSYTGFGLGVVTGVVGTPHTGLVVRNCETDHAGLLDYYASAATANEFKAYSNKGLECPTAFIKVSGISTATTDFDIYMNDVRGANRQYAAMAGIYTNALCSALGAGRVHHNYLYDCQNGTGSEFNGMPGSTNLPFKYGCPYDGSGIYFDLGSNRGVMFGNIIERCHVAVQTNSAKQAQIIGNIAIDCNVLATCTDAGSVGSNDVLVMNNTYINRLPTQNELKRGIRSNPSYGFTNWYENSTASSIRVINNAFYRQVLGGQSECVRIERDAGAKVYVGNAVYGWTTAQKFVAKRLIGPEVDDLTAAAISVLTDGAGWFEGTTATLLKDGSLTKAGTRYIDGLTDMTGTAFERIPSIGALEYTPS